MIFWQSVIRIRAQFKDLMRSINVLYDKNLQSYPKMFRDIVVNLTWKFIKLLYIMNGMRS